MKLILRRLIGISRLILVVSFIIFLTGCQTRAHRRSWLLAAPEPVNGGPIFTCGGFLELKSAIPLYAPSGGVVAEILIFPPRKVLPGELILKIFQPELEKSLSQINLELGPLKKEQSVYKQLQAEGLFDKNQSGQLFEKISALENSRDITRSQLEIRSPGGGWLTWLEPGIFSRVNQGQLVGYVLPERNPVAGNYRVRAEVPESFLESVWPGQKIQVTGNNIGRLAGEVTLVAPFARDSGANSQVEVLGNIINPPKNSLVNMPAEISFQTGYKKMIRVPRLAVNAFGSERFIYFLKGPDANLPRKKTIFPLFTGDEFVYLPDDPELKTARIILNYETENQPAGN